MPDRLTRFTKHTGSGTPMLDCSICELKYNGCGTNNCRWRIVRRLAELEDAIQQGRYIPAEQGEANK